MVRVYFASSNHTEIVAIFDSEESYERCRPSIVSKATEMRMTVIESVDEKPLNELLKEANYE